MTKNRKTLLDQLKGMDDEKLARVVELPCKECPAIEYCNNQENDKCNCPEIFQKWLGA
jgi:hypothetical protein